MSDYGRPPFGFSAREQAQDWTARRTAEAGESTKRLIEQLVESSVAAEAREVKMLFWTRVAGIAGIAALAATVIGIVVTVLVA